MVKVVGIKFKNAGKLYYFSPKEGDKYERNMPVIVETARGLEYAWVVYPEKKISDDEIVSPLKPVIRIATQKDKEMVTALQMAYECLARGIEFLPVDLMKSDSFKFLPENGKIRMPFSSIEGIGENAAIKIKEASDSNEIHSVEDFQQKTMLSKAVMETLEQNHVFDNLAKTNQMSLFDLL